MSRTWVKVEQMLVLSVLFSLVLLGIRIIISSGLFYLFFAWNLFLAVIPIAISRQLYKQKRLSFKAVLMLVCWLLFLPNAPYIITDIFHYKHRPPIPEWYDLLLVTSSAWNGLILGIISVLQVEAFLISCIGKVKSRLTIIGILILASFGIYIGRFLRFNSWDVMVKPVDLIIMFFNQVIHPFSHLRTWGFTLVFGVMLSLFYFTVKALSVKFYDSVVDVAE